MISLCVFSKDRAMQLDAFLKSTKKNASYVSDINVLYTSTHSRFNDAYTDLIKEHDNVNFIKEDRLHDQILDLVKSFKKYFLWTTDDSLFYKRSDFSQDKIEWVFNTKGAIAMNLRMGLNIKWQNHWHGEISQPIIVEDSYEDVIIWDADRYSVNTDVGRVWQNDASIMPTEAYLERMQIEPEWRHAIGVRGLDNIAGCGRIFKPCLVGGFRESVYLNVPVNLVHLLNDGRLYADNYSKFRHYSTKELNDLFLQNKRIDWENLTIEHVDCGRQELEYKFI